MTAVVAKYIGRSPVSTGVETNCSAWFKEKAELMSWTWVFWILVRLRHLPTLIHLSSGNGVALFPDPYKTSEKIKELANRCLGGALICPGFTSHAATASLSSQSILPRNIYFVCCFSGVIKLEWKLRNICVCVRASMCERKRKGEGRSCEV